jgi:hypothetical protein
MQKRLMQTLDRFPMLLSAQTRWTIEASLERFAPILYGAIADHSNLTIGVLASAATAVLIVPLVLTLRLHLCSSTIS